MKVSIPRGTPKICGLFAVGSFILSVLAIPVISSEEIARTYEKMAADTNDPIEKQKIETEKGVGVAAQNNREIFGFLFLGLSGTFAVTSLVSIFVRDKE